MFNCMAYTWCTVVTHLKKCHRKQKHVLLKLEDIKKCWRGNLSSTGRYVNLFSLGINTVNNPQNNMELYVKKVYSKSLWDNVSTLWDQPQWLLCHSILVRLVHNGFVIISSHGWFQQFVPFFVSGELMTYLFLMFKLSALYYYFV